MPNWRLTAKSRRSMPTKFVALTTDPKVDRPLNRKPVATSNWSVIIQVLQSELPRLRQFRFTGWLLQVLMFLTQTSRLLSVAHKPPQIVGEAFVHQAQGLDEHLSGKHICRVCCVGRVRSGFAIGHTRAPQRLRHQSLMGGKFLREAALVDVNGITRMVAAGALRKSLRLCMATGH